MSTPLDTVTIVLSGEVPLKEFAKAIEHFHTLIKSLTKETGDDSVDWVIDNLEISSTVATAKGKGELEKVERIVRAYADVGTALEQDTPIQYSQQVKAAAKGLRSVINGKVTSIRLETPEREAIIRFRNPVPAITPLTEIPEPITLGPPTTAFGAVEGRIQTLTNRGGLRFTIYDLLNDKAVNCYLEEGYEGIMRDSWGKLSVVTGLISRDPLSGRPLSIRKVKDVTVIPEETGDYRDARGVAPSLTDLSPEEAIRRLRDA